MKVIRCMCDICRRNDASDRNYKFKSLGTRWFKKRPHPRWHRIDICDDCFNGFLRLRDEPKLEETVKSKAVNECYKNYEDQVLQSVYLEGVEAALDAVLLPHKVQKKVWG